MQITLGQPFSFCQMGLRSNQEDARFPDSDIPDSQKPFFVVCDGVGGSDCGEVASKTVCKSFARTLDKFDWSQTFTRHDFSKALESAYKALDRVADEENFDMATTLAFAAFHQGGCMMAHIGDSRVYQFRPPTGILYRSEDHSLVGSLVESGILSPDEAKSHPQASTITRYMCPNVEQNERFDATVFQTTDIRQGDYILLCSDGVLNLIDEETLTGIICCDKDDEQKMKQLADLCIRSQDNNTAILIPVASVSQTVVHNEAEESDEAGSVTERITDKSFNIYEVGTERVSLMEKLSNLVNKIFN